MENKTLVPVVGGTTGWGGFVDTNGDSIIPSNASSDCLNVYEDNGILKKREGYTVNTGAFVLGGAYEVASTGSQIYDATHQPLSQEVYLTGTGSGADIDVTAKTCDVVIGISIKGKLTATPPNTAVKVSLYTVDGSGHPNTLIGELNNLRYFDSSKISDTEHYYYYCLNNITIPSANMCIVLDPASYTPEEIMQWYYAASAGYAPGGSRKAAYYNPSTTSWNNIANVAFKFKFYYRETQINYSNIFQYKGMNVPAEYSTLSKFINGYQGVESYISNIGDVKGFTYFIENENTGYRIDDYISSIGTHIFPIYAGTTEVKNSRILKSRLIIGSENFLFENSFNNWPLRIAHFTTANTHYGFAETPYGLIIVPDKNVPQIWGSTTYPISGYTGNAVFTGLTNPITLASTVMWHGHKLWYGDVTINSVNYPNRIYYSGTDSPESGYTDTNFITINGKVTALVDVGDYSVLADAHNTYLYLGGAVPSTSEMVQHPPSGGVHSQEAMCTWNGTDGSVVVFGWGSKGIFKIDRANKVYLNDKIIDKISNLIQGDVYACPDYARGMILFSYTILGVRKILGLNVSTGTWWNEDIDAKNMISVDVGNCTIPKIVGIKNYQWLNMYTGNYDDGDFIKAYYKTGPLYINDTKFKPRNFFVKYKNEPTISHLDVKYNLDYGTDSVKTLQNGNSNVTSNVPFIKKVEAHGEASSTEVTLYQDKITTAVNSDSNSGQAVLSVASITGFIVGHKVIINDGGAREETKVISSIGTASLTFTTNLTYTHTAVQGDAVDTYDESFSVASVDMEIYGSNKVPQDL